MYWTRLIPLVVLTVATALFAVGFVIGMLPGWRAISVVSGSMRPVIAEGDLVLVSVAPDLIREGQVVTYRNRTTGQLITHRIVSVHADGTVTTRGDANRVDDPIPVAPEDLVGAARLLIPYAGFPAYWISSGQIIKLGLTIIVGLTLIVTVVTTELAEFDPRSPGYLP
jgi:signal peptidase